MIIKKMNYLNVLFAYIVTNIIGEFVPLVVIERSKPPLVTLFS